MAHVRSVSKEKSKPEGMVEFEPGDEGISGTTNLAKGLFFCTLRDLFMPSSFCRGAIPCLLLHPSLRAVLTHLHGSQVSSPVCFHCPTWSVSVPEALSARLWPHPDSLHCLLHAVLWPPSLTPVPLHSYVGWTAFFSTSGPFPPWPWALA